MQVMRMKVAPDTVAYADAEHWREENRSPCSILNSQRSDVGVRFAVQQLTEDAMPDARHVLTDSEISALRDVYTHAAKVDWAHYDSARAKIQEHVLASSEAQAVAGAMLKSRRHSAHAT